MSISRTKMLQVSKCLIGLAGMVLRHNGQPTRPALRKLGECGGQARRAYLQGGRSLQSDGVPS